MDDYSDSKVKVRKFIHMMVFFIFLFLFVYIIFFSKNLYTDTKRASNDSIRQTKDCMAYTYDVRNLFYDKGKLSFDFYLFGFSEDSVDAVTVISDKCLKDCSEPINEACLGNSSLIVDYMFKREVRPGKTEQASLNIDLDKFFCIEIKDCSVTRVKKILG